MSFQNYLLSFHGADIGKIYNLPKNVRVYMYCFPNKPITANHANEARTWQIATQDHYDPRGRFMTRLKVYDDELDTKVPYCVFSGNLMEDDLNRVPDLCFEDEEGDFRTGLYHLPARFRRVFVKNCRSRGRSYNPGDIEELDSRVLNQTFKKVADTSSVDESATGFARYFLEPGTLEKKKYKDLTFVVIPHSDTYQSYLDLAHRVRGAVITRNKKSRAPTHEYDTSVPNTKDKMDSREVKRLEKETGGVFLSDIVRHLCNQHPHDFITIIVSACRCFNYMPKGVYKNQLKTTIVSASEYYRAFSKKDVA